MAGTMGEKQARGENDARMVAICFSRELGVNKQGKISELVGLKKTSSVSSAYLRMDTRVTKETDLTRTVQRIEMKTFPLEKQIAGLTPLGKTIFRMAGHAMRAKPVTTPLPPSFT